MRFIVLLVIAVFLVPVLAGCIDNSDGSSGTNKRGRQQPILTSGQAPSGFVATLPDGTLADPSTIFGVVPLSGVQRFIGAASFEPTLGIDAKNNIFMVAGVGNVRVSKDQGATWADTTAKLPANDPRTGQPARDPPNSNDPFVYVDKDTGRVYSSDLQALVCSWMTWSDDQGATWATDPAACGLPFGVHDHQSIATGKPRVSSTVGYPKMMYYCVNRVGDSSCASSLNGGLTFGPLVPVLPGADAEAGGLCGGLTGHVQTDHEGRVFLGKAQCGVPTVAVSEDDGRTWAVHPITRAIGSLGHDINIGVDSANNVYAFWIGDNGLPQLSISTDHGAKWTKPQMVAPPGITATYFGATYAMGKGKVAFAYIGTDHPKGYQNQGAEAWKGAVWHAYMGVIVNALEATPVVLTTRLDPEGDPVARNLCPPGRCNGMGDFFDVNIDANGRPWAAMVDVCNDKCVKDGDAGNNDVSRGFAGTLATGPALTDAGGALPPLPPVPPPSTP